MELERSNTSAANLEKKQRGFDKQLADVVRKQQETAGELDAAQRENRAAAAEVFRQRSHIEELLESIESLKRENKNLTGSQIVLQLVSCSCVGKYLYVHHFFSRRRDQRLDRPAR